MRVVAALVQIESPCPTCGELMVRLGTAPVVDGLIGEPRPLDKSARCNGRLERERRQTELDRERKRKQRSWAKGAPDARIVDDGDRPTR